MANRRIKESANQRIGESAHSPQPTTHNSKSTTPNPVIWILLLALCVRVAWLAQFPTNPIAPVDAEGFHLLAVNMLDGHGFAIGWEPPFCPTTVRTPLYPLFVAGSYTLVGRDPIRVLPLHLLLEVLTTALVMRLGRDLGGKRVGLWTGLLYACNGTTQRYTGYLLSEALLLPLLTASVWLTLRALRRPTAKRSTLAGLLWGLALLTKPNVQFLALLVGGLLTWRMANGKWQMANGKWRITNQRIEESKNQRIEESANRRIEKQKSPFRTTHNPQPSTKITPHASRITFLLFWLTLGLTLFPWLLRNRAVSGRWMLSTAFEENVARVSAVATLAEVDSVRVEPWTETWEYYYDRLVADVGARYGWGVHASANNACVELRRRQLEIARAARAIVSAHPLDYLRAHLRGVLTSLRDPSHRLWYHVLTGLEWESTGVIADIGARMAWSLERGAVGDALRALWTERVTRPPLLAALLWWGLSAARVAVWGLCGRGVWRLRRKPRLWLTLTGSIAYLLLLPGPIAHDRFYVPAVPLVAVLLALGGYGGGAATKRSASRLLDRRLPDY